MQLSRTGASNTHLFLQICHPRHLSSLAQSPSRVGRQLKKQKPFTHMTQGRPSKQARMATRASSEEYDFDLFTIGGGTAGVRASRLSATMGAKVALCELPFGLVMTDTEGGTGGTCVLRGCVPKKLLHYVAEFNEQIEEAAAVGWQLNGKPKIDFAKVMELKNSELKRLSELYKSGMTGAGVKYIEGRGKLIDAHTVQVNGKNYTAKNILIATGSKATKIPIEGAEHGIISDEVLALNAVPERLVIVGSSYIACEQATIYNNLGSDVHLYVRSGLVLKGFDEEGRKFIQDIYEQVGITLHLGESPVKMEKNSSGKITVHSETKDKKEQTLPDVDVVLFATGRKPNTKELGLEDVGVTLGEKGELKVDKYSKSVSHDNIWAIGDVTMRIPLTPVARMEGNMLSKHLFAKENNENYKNDYSAVAKVVFSSPPYASVGLTEEEAIEQEKDIDVFTSIFTPMKSSLSKRKGAKAFAKMISHSKTGKVLGVHFVGPEAAEIIQGFAVIVKNGLTKDQCDATVGLHPTSAEEFVLMTSPARQFRNGKLWLSEEQ